MCIRDRVRVDVRPHLDVHTMVISQSAFPICQKEPIMCSSLAQNMDKHQLATILGVDTPTIGKSKHNFLLVSDIILGC
jgi:hypothetical protein